jgi:hypothetical protein
MGVSFSNADTEEQLRQQPHIHQTIWHHFFCITSYYIVDIKKLFLMQLSKNTVGCQ